MDYKQSKGERERGMFFSLSSDLKLWLTILSVLAMFITSNCGTSCPDTCGNVPIPYPFGIGESCSLSDGFMVNCNRSNPNDARPFIGDMEIASIDLEHSQVQVQRFISYQCFNSSGLIQNYGRNDSLDLHNSPYWLSQADNILIGVGCDTSVYIYNSSAEARYLGGCITYCDDMNGIDNSTCSVKKDGYNFSTSDLKYMDPNRKFPLVLDWKIANSTCEETKRNKTGYACVAENSYCDESTDGHGYVCKCSKGYRGNPYLQNGCQDVDECMEGTVNCKGICVNTNGSYQCTCPLGTTGNPTGDGCFKENNNKISNWAKLGLGIGVGLPVIFIVGSYISWVFQNRKLKILKEEFFRQNGGLFLQEKMSSNQINTFKIFTLLEMEKATNKFNEQNILGKGGNGIVYKGFLNDGRIVAIKKSMLVETNKSNEFANEMLILSNINHVNVVKLLGCCLEVEVPMLVYEYIPNGTLFELIHSEHQMTWNLRLRIGAQSAKALSYLHSEASPPILHGDIKSSNILLGDNLTAKVSDFGTSTFAPKDKSRFMTLIQGTYGYLDPEYLLTGELTEKSDVYSFGVVMVELLTGKKAVYKDEDNKEKNLGFEFISCMKEGRLIEILDPHIKDGSSGTFPNSSLEDIKVVADVVKQCLSVTGEERPTITQVYVVLEGLSKSELHPWVHQNMDELESLLSEEQKSQSSFKLDRNEDNSTSQPISTAEIEMDNIGRGR